MFSFGGAAVARAVGGMSGAVSGTAGSASGSSDTAPPSSLPPTHSDWSIRTALLSPSISDTSSTGSVGPKARGWREALPWDELRFGIHIYPFRRYAHCKDDVFLLAAFLELSELLSIGGDSVKLLLRMLAFLRSCDYQHEDLCSILAHASAYFVDVWDLCGSHMDEKEVGNVLCSLSFVAHCYVQDEMCPLHVWHRHLLHKYCDMRTLNSAVVRLLQVRHYVLRLPSEDFSWRYGRLIRALPTSPG